MKKKQESDIGLVILMLVLSVTALEKIKTVPVFYWYYGAIALFWIIVYAYILSRKKTKEHLTTLGFNLKDKIAGMFVTDSKKSLNLGNSSPILKNNTLGINHPSVQDVIYKGHQIIFGASGSGKTFSVLRPQLMHAIEHGQFVVIIDPKGDISFKNAIESYCYQSNRSDDFVYFSLTHTQESSTWNPFKGRNKSESKDLIINSTDWSEPFYQKMAEAKLLEVFDEIEDATLSQLIEEIPRSKNLEGLIADLKIMKNEEYGKLIDQEDAPSILDFYQQKKVCFFSLDVQAYPTAAVKLGRILLSGLMGVSNWVQTNLEEATRVNSTICIDEFGSFFTETFINFLNKARSSNFRLIMATQSLGDIRSVGEYQLPQILDSTTTKVIMRMGDPDSAEYCSKIFGTKDSSHTTKQVQKTFFGMRETGQGSVGLQQEFIVHPNSIKALNTGEGYILTHAPYSCMFIKFRGDQFKIKKERSLEFEEIE